MPDGSLVPRSEPEAIITDPEVVVRRMIRLVKDEVIEAIDGTELKLSRTYRDRVQAFFGGEL